MASFAEILSRARLNLGAEALERRLPQPKTGAELRGAGDDRYLSLMCLRIFRAGLKHGIVDAKWPIFEEAFFGFDPRRIRALSDEALEAYQSDARLIRHWGKIKAVRANAAALISASEESGGFGAYLADWPPARTVELWEDIAKRFSQMGGNFSPYFLRMAGKDSFLLTGDVVRALGQWGVVDAEPKGKAARRRVQEAFNQWAEESGRPLCQISMILALSAG